MANYHVGNGFAAIYAGTLDKTGRRWTNKSDVTEEAVAAVFTHLIDEGNIEETGEEYVITYPSSDYEMVVRRKSNE